MGTTTIVALAAANAANTAAMANSHYCHNNPNDDKQMLAIFLAIVIPCVLWIVYTSIRQLFRRERWYNFFEDNLFALVILGVFVFIGLFMVFANFIYMLIK